MARSPQRQGQRNYFKLNNINIYRSKPKSEASVHVPIIIATTFKLMSFKP